ncbi:MAG: hypothetical protein OXH96_13160 [Spirochaetaceae bacterium]|nr:hypothetical protein [Spirochaetaceae bacterium]
MLFGYQDLCQRADGRLQLLEHFAGQGEYDDTAWALSFQAAAGIGYTVMESLTLTLGYRLIGTMEANFSKYSPSKAKAGMTLSHTVELGLRFSF